MSSQQQKSNINHTVFYEKNKQQLLKNEENLFLLLLFKQYG